MTAIDFDLSRISATASLPAGFLGDLFQVGIVTRELKRSVQGFLKLGIGPWNTYTFDKHTCTDLEYAGKPADFAFKIALANMPGLMWELIQPLSGDNAYSDFLSSHGEGLHHLLFKCNNLNWESKRAAFEAAGYVCIQSGKWQGTMAFAYYNTDKDASVLIEITDIPSDWKRPVPDETYS